MPGEFLVIQKEDGMFYFLCSHDCPIEKISRSFDWYIVSKDKFNDHLTIGIGLADKEPIEGELYRLQDETTLNLYSVLHSKVTSSASSFPTIPISKAKCAMTEPCASISTIITRPGQKT